MLRSPLVSTKSTTLVTRDLVTSHVGHSGISTENIMESSSVVVEFGSTDITKD